MNIVAFEYVCFFCSVYSIFLQQMIETASAFPILLQYALVDPCNNKLEETTSHAKFSAETIFSDLC